MTGGIRSGKSAYAEGLLRSDRAARYIATGPATSDDEEWAARVAAHRGRRPEAWTTIETPDAADAISTATAPVLLDSVGSWLTGQLDSLGAWQPNDTWKTDLGTRLDTLVGAIAGSRQDLVVVTEEVGLALVSAHRSGRLYADLLGSANQRIAAVCDRVVLVIAGCPLVIKPIACPQCNADA